eukprot:CAMPEP_0204422736 /NCGR_PEP_ID=MMETSP0470-20130426/37084_1 /ASSEMBLY_ACC=CAM_ASM_000385 /TAXON_ID=2969 /ORGANISM="Oxyrrhis marina" /LENGTH=34 /DNA_ID= /DNA_START= /DNA_END= /DNA_ORIENTATION=
MTTPLAQNATGLATDKSPSCPMLGHTSRIVVLLP